ncbi:hypothetical protein ATI61_11373 [Archangium gephyra]|uniref:Uncharacterized protein n=1 Tax=Archangium gephyra TaxID=48 RepID=A0AAC8Q8N3_9BACT|nr:hypothetical protein [Archangium gephyra]AKJ02884.1 Hypothetical protein AA314_04510 [Archangium gephyra]REG25010.1 hypothetical protein ATI61_11373 [Archangium gephyra]
MAPPARSTAKAPARGGTGARAAASSARPGAARSRAPTEVEAPGGAAVKVGGEPENDPRFRKVIEQLEKGADKTKRHPPASAKAAEAQAAAVPPANARLAGAQANQVDAMKEAETPKAEPDSFLALLREEIDKIMPRSLDDADKFLEGGETARVKGAVSGGVRQQKDAAAGPTQQAASATPDPSGVPQKEVTPLPQEKAPEPLAINAAEAMPAPRPESDVAALGTAKQDADQQLQDAKLTPPQLQKANDPRFSAVLTARSKVEKVATGAPGRYRASEKVTITQSAARAQADAKTGLSALTGARTTGNTQVTARQLAAKAQQEKRHGEITSLIQGIYARTAETVDAKLKTLEPDVMRMFDVGAEAAMSDMRDFTDRELARVKRERYAGVEGAARWVADLIRPVPEEIKAVLRQARARFATTMDTLAKRIASTVEQRLKEAKDEIARGQTAIKDYLSTLKGDELAVGQQAAEKVAACFEQLSHGIEERKQGLARKLAQKYKEAHDNADAALKKLEEENGGALKGLADAVGEVVKVLTEFKDKLMAILRKGADTIELILKDPIGFLSNLIAALKQGFNQFVGNIGAHLKRGFMQWLFGALAEAGIQIPSDLNVWSILKLVLDVLGLTYAWMRSEAVKLVGERNVALIEKLIDYITVTIRGGPQALWEKLKEDLSNLKEMVIDAIQGWLIDTVVKQAVTKVLSLFNPAGAIVQAVLAIYNVVMWVIENASRIMALVEAVVNSVHAIATGAIGGAAAWIERSLANGLPIAIAFLARLIGLGGLSGKIREFITKTQAKVRAAVLGWLKKAWAWVKKLFGKLTGKGKDKSKSDAEHARMGRAAEQALAKRPEKDLPGDELSQDRQQKARELENQYNPQLAPEVRMKITVKPAARQDTKVRFHIHIGPNDYDKDGTAESGSSFDGVLPLYRGIYYTPAKFSEEDYQKQINPDPANPPRKTIYSAAVIELAGGKTPDGSDVPEEVLQAAEATVKAEMEAKGKEGPTRSWWARKKQEFETTRLALLQRYVNKYGEFGKELKKKDLSAYKDLSFSTVPFISTSKKALHAARYAVGAKLNKAIPRRTSGIVGRVFVYLFGKQELQNLGALEIKKLQTSKQVKIHPHIIHEGEVTFTGSVPGQNMVGQVDAQAGQSESTVAKSAEGVAKSNAAGKELGEWES